MEPVITTTEAARHMGDVLARIKYTGQGVVLTKSNKAIARLVPVEVEVGGRGDAIMQALARLPQDGAFAPDLESVNRQDRVAEDPWG